MTEIAKMDVHPVTLTGRRVRLEPLSLDHLPGLVQVGLDEDIWRYMLYGDIRTEADLRRWVEDMLERQKSGSDLPFAVVMQATGAVAGATRYLEIRREHRALEIGGTWFGRAYRGRGVNVESKYLLLRHAFETLGCVRVQFKADLRNERSQRAIERLGAVREGVLRQHLITPSGYRRDSVYYSILDHEWPRVKAHLISLIEGG